MSTTTASKRVHHQSSLTVPVAQMEKQQEAKFDILDMAHIFTSTNTTSQRHLACIPCRQQKVRCDGQKPRCKRCGSGRSTLQCTYPQASSKRGRPRKQATHAVPGLSSRNSSPSNASCESASLLRWDDSGLDNNSLGAAPSTWPSTATTTSPGSEHIDPLANVSYTDNVLHTAMDIDTKDKQMDMFDADFLVDDTTSDCLPRGLTETLLLEYFNQCQRSFCLFENKASLLSVLDDSSQVLKYSASAHALCLRAQSQRRHSSRTSIAGTSSLGNDPGRIDHANLFYSLGRTALHQNDMGRRSSTTMLQTLQATILTSLYELQQAEFGCAWLSASRALWLTEELQLRILVADRVSSLSSDKQQATRRAFWAVSGLSALFMMSQGRKLGGALTASVSDIELPANLSSSNLGVTITDIDLGTCPRLLSTEEGLCAVRCLTMHILSHASRDSAHGKSSVDTVVNQQPYSFWTHQSRLEESLSNLQAVTSSAASSAASSDSSSSLGTATLFGIHVKALSVVLGEVKLARLQGNPVFGLDEVQIALCGDAVYQSSLDLVKAFGDLDESFPFDITTNITLSWIIYVVLQSLLRRRYRQKKIPSWSDLKDFDFPIPGLNRTSSFGNDGSSTYPDEVDFFTLQLSRNNSFSSDGAEMCLGMNQEDFMPYTATPPSSVSSSSNASWPSTNTDLTEAVVLDSFEALHSRLRESAARIPIASIFLRQIEEEISCSSETLATRVIGQAGAAGTAW